ncbi:MAG: bifunctional folylpolyglutamate synthase/dihydrofolate synthase [Akkermansia sp.]|nr:bifunctional folylpolyglutamate synthase/dihydrofolate synthase [Akkermansia sp.]
MADYKEALDWLYSTQMFGIKLGLEGITRLLQECGVLYPRARVVHVAGTNGKGSTCAFAESVARAAGYSTGLFTSPHLVEFGERIRVNGQMISQADSARLICRVRSIIEPWEHKPTFFELVLAIAMLYFAEREVDIIILETGMGGRLDATNAVPKDVAVLTPIGMDHTQYLGSTLTEIAAEKAAIISWHRPAVSAPQQPECVRAIHAAAQRMDTDYRIISEECTLPLGLRGPHQRQNAALALAALRALPHFLASEDEIARGLAEVQWPGRFEEIAPRVIMDGAHNPPAIRVLVESWRQAFGEQRARCIYAGSADKALDEVLELLSPIVGEWVLPPVQSPRILPPEEMARKVAAASGAPICTPLSMAEALAELPPYTLICGSFFLLGEAKAHLQQHPDYRKTEQ